jgi:hypothetical protein
MRKLMLLDDATLDGYLARRADANAAALMPIIAGQFDWQADVLADYDTLLIGSRITSGPNTPCAYPTPATPAAAWLKLTPMSTA